MPQKILRNSEGVANGAATSETFHFLNSFAKRLTGIRQRACLALDYNSRSEQFARVARLIGHYPRGDRLSVRTSKSHFYPGELRL
jgi:hypothetical protein